MSSIVPIAFLIVMIALVIYNRYRDAKSISYTGGPADETIITTITRVNAGRRYPLLKKTRLRRS